MPPTPSFPSRRRLLRGFGAGGGYLALLAFAVATAFERPYLQTVVFVFATGLTQFVLTLVLAARWALRAPNRRFQLELASVFLVLTTLAVHLAAVRWLLHASDSGLDPWTSQTWMETLIRLFVLYLLSAPSVLFLGDVLLALAAWFVWRPGVRACRNRWFSR